MYFDAKSVVSIYFIKQKETFNLKPCSFSVDLEFENQHQRNMSGEIIGTLKTFKEGYLRFELKAADFFELPASMLDGELDFYISYISEDDLSLICDKMKVTISLIKFQGSEEDLSYFMEFEFLDSMQRSNSDSGDFTPLFSPSSTYFIRSEGVHDAVKIKVKGSSEVIALPFITHLAYSNKNEIETKRFAQSSVFDFYTKGINCGILEIGTVIYSTTSTWGNEMPKDTSKENIIGPLIEILKGSETLTGNKFYSLEIENEMINTLNILELDFILVDIKAEYKNNATELSLVLVENRFAERHKFAILEQLKRQTAIESPFKILSLGNSEIGAAEEMIAKRLMNIK